jgi:hypothetical protein
MKFGLGHKLSDLFIVVYVMATLFIRFMLEPDLHGNFIISIVLGLFSLLFLWALVKTKLINPTWFGLMPKKKDEIDKKA